jgi:hypothetical protein
MVNVYHNCTSSQPYLTKTSDLSTPPTLPATWGSFAPDKRQPPHKVQEEAAQYKSGRQKIILPEMNGPPAC